MKELIAILVVSAVTVTGLIFVNKIAKNKIKNGVGSTETIDQEEEVPHTPDEMADIAIEILEPIMNN